MYLINIVEAIKGILQSRMTREITTDYKKNINCRMLKNNILKS